MTKFFAFTVFAALTFSIPAAQAQVTVQDVGEAAGSVLLDTVFAPDEAKLIRDYYNRKMGRNVASTDTTGQQTQNRTGWEGSTYGTGSGTTYGTADSTRSDDGDRGSKGKKDKGKKDKGKDKGGKKMPPGLAKRGGDLPPGLQKRVESGKGLPPGLATRDLPISLQTQLPPRADTQDRILTENGDVVLVEKATGVVLDI